MRIAILLLWHLAACIQARLPDLPAPVYDEAIDNGAKGFYPAHKFKTFKNDVRAPLTNFLKWNPACDDGLHYFITPRGRSMPHVPGPMILDSRGELVWAHHFKNYIGGEGYNLQVQPYKGKDHLTFWVGEDRVQGHGAGHNYVLNSSYDVVQKYVGAKRLFADIHEFSMTNDNSALMTAYQVVPHDVTMLRTFGANDENPNHVWDCVVQEVDLQTHRLKWQWRATEHVRMKETYRPILTDGTRKNPFDWFHLNSVQKDELGNYLISSRFTHSIMYINGRTKKTMWSLGGKRNNFIDLSGGNATNFAWQHDAQLHQADTFPSLYTPTERPGYTTKLLTLFDNAAENVNYTYGLPFSRGLLLELTYPSPGSAKARVGPQVSYNQLSHRRTPPTDINVEKVEAINGSDPKYTVRVIMSYENPNNLQSSSQGNMQLIPQGPGKDPKVLVGYGLNAAWTEFAANGTVLCDVHFAAKTSFETGELMSYRVFKQPWIGRPRWKPKVVIDTDLYVSWLGATGVAEWIVQSSLAETRDEDAWSEILRVRKTKFEESISIPTGLQDARYLRVIALDNNRARMENGVSDPIYRGWLAAHFPAIYDRLPRVFTDVASLRILAILTGITVILLVLYGLYWRYWHGRIGGLGSGRFRWRKGVAYQRLANLEGQAITF